ncbi:DUF4870 domain-containing protein [Staphylococcus sp. 17KM0847]|uniref:DUF4870 domain-containing protein n=1 Tax=Staphylococcus sp. 17KM0847 TaxID=2583989 RepID=UPI0015DBCEFE|nr:DUF4870 domain-containing protein [Staphylococcus sp. 17KM0847]QLK86664.1 DUF4870 domain-containing protein [Staphylococcus sp. 17KM0847]
METPHTDTQQTHPIQPTSDERLMAVLIYVLHFFTTFIGPVIIWLVKHDESEFVDKTGKNYFNFIFSYLIWSTISFILIFLLVGIVLFPIVLLLSFIFNIVAIIKAYHGEDYLPPLSIRFFK